MHDIISNFLIMEITIIGSGTLSPSLKRQSAGIIIKIYDKILMFDSGSGVFYKLLSAGIDYKNINDIFYSHFIHPDHINDLPFIIFANIYDNPQRTSALNITGPPGFTGFYDKLLCLYPILNKAQFDVLAREVNDEILRYDNFIISTKPMDHRGASAAGYRIESGGKSAVYTGDTDYCENAVELARGADVLIIECSFPDELKADGHLTPEYAARIAEKAGVRKLVLTHMYPVCEEFDVKAQAEKFFGGEIVVAEDFMRIKLQGLCE